jgi:hypothetical protein
VVGFADAGAAEAHRESLRRAGSAPGPVFSFEGGR